METEEAITARYKKEHKRFEKLYYKDKALSKEEFDQLHGANWDALSAELLAAGYKPSPKPRVS